jgi:hypothetical protein
MNQRRPRSEDILFISALAAILLGVAFLLYTTNTFIGAPRAWPIMVMAAGGLLLYFALVRGASFSIFFGGILLALEGAFFLASMLLGWKLSKSWPLAMATAGVAGFVSGLAAKRRLMAFFAVPSIGFTSLGLIFALFSFGLARVSFKNFIAVWWPSLLIAGGISLFVAYGISRGAANRGRRSKTRAGKPADRSGQDRSRWNRGPSSGP